MAVREKGVLGAEGVGYEPGGSPFADGRALFATVLVGSTNAHSKVGVILKIKL